MNDIVNLNKFRKARKKADKQQKSAENKVLHGRTKVEKKRDQSVRRGAEDNLDGHKLDPEAPSD
jgi:hypothetical protein